MVKGLIKAKHHDSELKGFWRIQDDQIILNYIHHKIISSSKIMWPKLSALFLDQNRSSRSCNERWVNQLDPIINRSPWNEEETHLIYAMRTLKGMRWIEIQQLFLGRTDNSIKNYYNSTMKK